MVLYKSLFPCDLWFQSYNTTAFHLFTAMQMKTIQTQCGAKRTNTAKMCYPKPPSECGMTNFLFSKQFLSNKWHLFEMNILPLRQIRATWVQPNYQEMAAEYTSKMHLIMSTYQAAYMEQLWLRTGFWFLLHGQTINASGLVNHLLVIIMQLIIIQWISLQCHTNNINTATPNLRTEQGRHLLITETLVRQQTSN